MSIHKDDYALRQIVKELFEDDKYNLSWEYDYPVLSIFMEDKA